ncbi:hypothetical protein B0X34_07910 [Helicobacter pylori]|nr:hypothetical protein B0X34_07910 [Helicobacter pylori]
MKAITPKGEPLLILLKSICHSSELLLLLSNFIAILFIPFLKISFSYENCTFQTFKSNHYTTLRH